MERTQLRYLVAVADAGSFTAAAERLHVAQSGLSSQVAKLERELGLPLLERLPRGVVPTTAGLGVIRAARDALGALGAVAEAAARHTGLRTGRVDLGTVRGGVTALVTAPLSSLRAEHPGVAVRVVEGDSGELTDAVRAGRLDLALVGWSGPDPEGVATTTFVEEGLAVVVPADHRLAGGRGRVGLRSLLGDPVLALSTGTGARAALDRASAAAGTRVELAVESGEPATLVALVRLGLGVAVMSVSTATAHAGGLVVRPLASDVTSRLGLVHRDPLSPAAADLRRRMVAAGAPPVPVGAV
ncbi:LysR family transcriptional regulator [uncultured Nocardioides sp.]|uniref:LysR family transcriptional regulator n=1 Tax=uncultured Nocardioides sp. TaxID=198441 RepID=UPI00260AE8FC|nr:LysR family transcriptional regulator [uncultured Nocardioides sp.]